MNRTVKIILAAAALTAVLSTFLYFRYPYDTLTAEMAEVHKTVTGSGFILRGETVVENESTGVFEPLVKDGTRVARGSTVGTVISGDLDEKLAEQLEDVTGRIDDIKRSESIADLYASDDARIYSVVKELAADIRAAAEKSDYSAAQDCKNRLSIIAEKSAASKTGGARDELLLSLQKEQYELETRLGGVRDEIAAPAAGFFYSSLDGLEYYGNADVVGTLKAEDIDGFSEIMKEFKPDSGQLAKIEDSYAWYLAATVKQSEAVDISQGDAVMLSIDEQAAVSATVLAKNEENGTCALIIKSTRSVQGITDKRTCEFEIETKAFRGLRVPAEAIRVKGDVTGVYVVSENKAVSFKCVDMLCRDGDFYVVKNKYTPPEGSKFQALKIYDKILVNPEAVRGYDKDIGKS